MFWLIPVIAISGAIAYYSYQTSKKEEIEKAKKGKLKDYNYKKSDLPSKIRFWDDIKGAMASGKWKGGSMPSEFRHYEKFNDKTKKWERIDNWEFKYIEFWGDSWGDGSLKDKEDYGYYIHKKPKGKEGKYFISYFVNPPKPYNFYTKNMKDKSKKII